LVGFCLPLSLRGAPESLGALARKFVPRGVRIIVYGLLLNLLVLRDEPILAGGVLQTIGLAIIVMTPALWLLRFRAAPVVLLTLAVVVYDWWAATPVRIGLARDFLLNRHRTPRGATLFWVFGMLFVSLGATYWVMEVRRLRLRWLVVLGQTALFLYFVHQVIVFVL